MVFAGLQKLSLLDFPGRVATTVFTKGCNLRCPFCHNASLVVRPGEQIIDEEDLVDFLTSRVGLVDGICVTGGEPTLYKDLPRFIARVKETGYAVKLDTNGTNPGMLSELIGSGNLDYVAMDVKNTFAKYPLTVGIDGFDISDVKKSIEILMEGRVDYEFRTTLVREYHTKENVTDIARMLSGASKYFLQTFKDSGDLIVSGLSAYSAAETEEIAAAAREVNPNVFVRGE